MAKIAVKVGTSEPVDDTLLEGQIGLRVDDGNEAIYTGDSGTLPSSPIKLTNNYSDGDKAKVGYLDVTKDINLDATKESVGNLEMYSSINKKLVDATCSIVNDGSSPIQLQSSDITVPFDTSIASNDTTVIEVDPANNTIILRKAGRYAFAIESSVEAGALETASYVLSLKDINGNLIDVTSYTSDSITPTYLGEITKVHSEIIVDIANDATLPIGVLINVKTTPASSFILNDVNASVLVDLDDANLIEQISDIQLEITNIKARLDALENA